MEQGVVKEGEVHKSTADQPGATREAGSDKANADEADIARSLDEAVRVEVVEVMAVPDGAGEPEAAATVTTTTVVSAPAASSPGEELLAEVKDLLGGEEGLPPLEMDMDDQENRNAVSSGQLRNVRSSEEKEAQGEQQSSDTEHSSKSQAGAAGTQTQEETAPSSASEQVAEGVVTISTDQHPATGSPATAAPAGAPSTCAAEACAQVAVVGALNSHASGPTHCLEHATLAQATKEPSKTVAPPPKKLVHYCHAAGCSTKVASGTKFCSEHSDDDDVMVLSEPPKALGNPRKKRRTNNPPMNRGSVPRHSALVAFMDWAGLSEYTEVLLKGWVALGEPSDISESDLAKLGMPRGACSKLKRALKRWQEGVPAAPPPGGATAVKPAAPTPMMAAPPPPMPGPIPGLPGTWMWVPNPGQPGGVYVHSSGAVAGAPANMPVQETDEVDICQKPNCPLRAFWAPVNGPKRPDGTPVACFCKNHMVPGMVLCVSDKTLGMRKRQAAAMPAPTSAAPVYMPPPSFPPPPAPLYAPPPPPPPLSYPPAVAEPPPGWRPPGQLASYSVPAPPANGAQTDFQRSQEVSAFLKSVRLEEFTGVLLEAWVDMEELTEMSEAELVRMGLPLGAAKKLQRALARRAEGRAPVAVAQPVAGGWPAVAQPVAAQPVAAQPAGRGARLRAAKQAVQPVARGVAAAQVVVPPVPVFKALRGPAPPAPPIAGAATSNGMDMTALNAQPMAASQVASQGPVTAARGNAGGESAQQKEQVAGEQIRESGTPVGGNSEQAGATNDAAMPMQGIEFEKQNDKALQGAGADSAAGSTAALPMAANGLEQAAGHERKVEGDAAGQGGGYNEVESGSGAAETPG